MKKIILLFIFLFPVLVFSNDDGLEFRLEFRALKCRDSERCTSKWFLEPMNKIKVPFETCNPYFCRGSKIFTFLFDDIFFFTKVDVSYRKDSKTYNLDIEFGANHIQSSYPSSSRFSLSYVPEKFGYYEMEGDKLTKFGDINYYKGNIIIQGIKETPPTDSLF